MPTVIVDAAVAQADPGEDLLRAFGPQFLDLLPAATRVLQVGSSSAACSALYRSRHGGAQWQTACIDTLNEPNELNGGFDLVLLDVGLHLRADMPAVLQALKRLCAPGGRLFAWARNALRAEVFARLAESDLSPLDSDGPVSHSMSSVFKLLMDAGWMPRLAAESAVTVPHADGLAAALQLGTTLGVPRATTLRNLQRDKLLIEANAVFGEAAAAPGPCEFSVVVPTTREAQLRLNVEHSPGLREVGAPIISCRLARHPAEAMEQAAPHCDAEWVLFCHQDVYFPSGFGVRLNALLRAIQPEDRDRTLIGFAGMGMDLATGRCRPAGFVIDRGDRFDHPASAAAVSLDELAIVVSRHSVHRIDPRMGWHLWATDLCLTAMRRHDVLPAIVRLPLFHNSNNDYRLPDAFHGSAAYLAAKHAGVGTIRTLCGEIPAPMGEEVA